MAEVNESPQVEAPVVNEEPVKESKEESPDSPETLLAELKRLGVERPEQVQGMFDASQQTGRAWNEVGDLRKEVDRLTQVLNERQAPQQQAYEPEYGEQPIDLQKALREGIRAEMGAMEKARQESMQRYYSDWNRIQSDEDYGVVGEVFQQHINSPSVSMQLQAGKTDLEKEYGKAKIAYYRNLVKRTTSVLEQSQGINQKPPHMESANSQSVPSPDIDDANAEAKKQIIKKRQSGVLSADDALEAMVKNMLPADDPIWRR